MDIPTDPAERAATYARYKRAHETQRKLKPLVDAMAEEDLAAGTTIKQLSELTGIGEEVFRRKARKAEVPVDPRYADRAAKLRRATEDAPPAE
jgi:hypothetical protein